MKIKFTTTTPCVIHFTPTTAHVTGEPEFRLTDGASYSVGVPGSCSIWINLKITGPTSIAFAPCENGYRVIGQGCNHNNLRYGDTLNLYTTLTNLEIKEMARITAHIQDGALRVTVDGEVHDLGSGHRGQAYYCQGGWYFLPKSLTYEETATVRELMENL